MDMLATRSLRSALLLVAALLAAGALAACGTVNDAVDQVEDEADDTFSGGTESITVDLEDTDAPGTVMGRVRFYEDGNFMNIEGQVEGLSEGPHGFHVHENGSCDMGDDGTPAGAAGGHFNPDGAPHGDPDDPEGQRHVGDFGNINAGADGMANVSKQRGIPDGDYDVDGLEGKAVIVHQRRDDLETQPSGNAGARVACGILR